MHRLNSMIHRLNNVKGRLNNVEHWSNNINDSDHNIIELYWWNRNALINDVFLYDTQCVFQSFNVKFHYNAQNNERIGQIKLSKLEEECAQCCAEIYSILKSENGMEKYSENDQEEDFVFDTVQDIASMGYNKIWEFFYVLKNKFSYNKQIMDILNKVSSNLSEMWKISRNNATKN